MDSQYIQCRKIIPRIYKNKSVWLTSPLHRNNQIEGPRYVLMSPKELGRQTLSKTFMLNLFGGWVLI